MPVTPNHSVNIPTVGGDADEWGTENNDAHIAWDDILSGPQATVLGRVAASDGPYASLTATQLTTIPNAVVGDSGAGGVKGLVPAPATGDAAAGKVLKADGTWGFEIRAGGTFAGATGATVAARNMSVVRGSTGSYTITLSPALPNANYAVFYGLQDTNIDTFAGVSPAGKTTTGFGFTVESAGGAAYDPAEFYLQVVSF